MATTKGKRVVTSYKELERESHPPLPSHKSMGISINTSSEASHEPTIRHSSLFYANELETKEKYS